MDNLAIARILREIADLLEIKDDNPFKIRAYRNGADIVANHPHELATLDEAGLREIPGIGKDLAARIREIGETGDAAYHRELVAEFPPTILDLLHLQGVGPEDRRDAVPRARHPHARRSRSARRRRPDSRASRHGREEGGADPQGARGAEAVRRPPSAAGRARRRRGARRPTCASARPMPTIEPVGSLRRGCDTCGDLDLLASGAPASLMDAFVEYRLVERVLGHGETKSSVLLQGGFQADLRLVAADSRGAALQYFTGSKAHNIALRDRAIGLGLQAERIRPVPDRGRRARRRRARGRHLRRARPRLDSAGAARDARRDRRRPKRTRSPA